MALKQLKVGQPLEPYRSIADQIYENLKNSIKAKVQGSQRRAYSVNIGVDVFSDAKWEKIIEVG